MPKSGNYEVLASSSAELKRKQIIEAARVVLARDGLGGCTARAVADASPLTKSAIHYYFRDIDEIVDYAVAAHLDAMLTTLREVAADDAASEQRLCAVVETYLATFAERPYAAFLWFEYWIAAGRRNATDAVAAMLAQVQELLEDLLSAAHAADPATSSRRLHSWLLGTVVQQHVRPLDPGALRAEIDSFVATLTGPPTTRASEGG
ncbi:TetR/AcrR family transcriptional regulator [Nocardia transvalensis]|uniref:TetR/AcrR family transcriptional regulator n=1 Tax=Nocardia transvalensis TaxID=37333 RepID=UPI002B4AF07B|nr:TetR family transcriptional regulator [Nocardia transvalensis]